MRRWGWGILLGALLSAPAWADEPADAGAALDAGSAADAGERAWASCVERVPEGATRPKVEEAFPERGFSGYVAYLSVTLTHGKGETVLPEGFKVQGGGEAGKALSEAAFVIPEADAGVSATITTTPGETTR